MDVKKGAGKLTRVQRIIKKAVEDREVAWQTLHLADE